MRRLLREGLWPISRPPTACGRPRRRARWRSRTEPTRPVFPARSRTFSMCVLSPFPGSDICPAPHQHFGKAVAKTANRNRDIHPVRELVLGCSPGRGSIGSAGYAGIGARPAAERKPPPRGRRGLSVYYGTTWQLGAPCWGWPLVCSSTATNSTPMGAGRKRRARPLRWDKRTYRGFMALGSS